MERKVRISVSGKGRLVGTPESVRISVDRQDSVLWVASKPFRVVRLKRRGKKRGPPQGPFFRPFPRRGEPFRTHVNSGPAREGAYGTYAVCVQFDNGKTFDPIIIINQ